MLDGTNAKPTIGVTPLYDGDLDSVWMYPGYLNGVLAAGGVPLILPYTDDLETLECAASACDGYLFTGGQDVDPLLYADEDRGFVEEINPIRDISEGLFFRDALDHGKPILGICRGVQIINVLMGGTLIQDIEEEAPSQVVHIQSKPYENPVHSVRLFGGMRDLMGTGELFVNSCHHQAVLRLAEGLEMLAQSPDGIVEAIRVSSAPFVWAVQWHPEFLLETECSKRLFACLVSSALGARHGTAD